MLFDLPGVYEVRFLPAGDCDRLPLLFATDDESAVELAILARDHREMEIWRGCRLVASYPAQATEIMMPSTNAPLPIISPVSFDMH